MGERFASRLHPFDADLQALVGFNEGFKHVSQRDILVRRVRALDWQALPQQTSTTSRVTKSARSKRWLSRQAKGV